MHVTEVHAKSVMRTQQLGVRGHLQCTPCGGEVYGTLLKNVKLFMVLPFIMLTIYPVDKAHISKSDNNDYHHLDLANFSSFIS